MVNFNTNFIRSAFWRDFRYVTVTFILSVLVVVVAVVVAVLLLFESRITLPKGFFRKIVGTIVTRKYVI